MIPQLPQAPLWARQLINNINKELTRLGNPGEPVKMASFTTDNMPSAADYSGCQLWNTTISRVCVSDGTNWLRQDTGASV